MSFPILTERKRFYCSYDYLDALIASAPTCPVTLAALKDHVVSGLANYTVTPVDDELASIARFRHHDLMTYAMTDDLSVSALACLAQMHRASLTNVVPHRPVQEFLTSGPLVEGCRLEDLFPPSLADLLDQVGEMSGWVEELERVYRESPFLSAGWSPMLSIGFDCVMLADIQAQVRSGLARSGDHEAGGRYSDRLNSPFIRRTLRTTSDQGLLLEGLFSSLSMLTAFGVLRQSTPDRHEWVHLLSYPEAALRCDPDGMFALLPGPDALRDISLRSGQDIPEQIFLSPDPDTIARYLRDTHSEISWFLLTAAGPDTQAVVVRSPMARDRYSVFVAHARNPVVFYAGDLEPSLRNFWGEALYAMATGGSEQVTQIAQVG